MKRKSKATWWQSPRGAATWLLLAAEEAIESVRVDRLKREASGYSPSQRAMLENVGGGRYGVLLSLLLSVVEAYASKTDLLQLERVRLWLREGFVPPELPPPEL